MDLTSWKSITPRTPQQGDVQSCGVYVIKVGTHMNIKCVYGTFNYH